MSSPAGSTPMLSPAELQKFEAPLIALANLSGGDLRKLVSLYFFILCFGRYYFNIMSIYIFTHFVLASNMSDDLYTIAHNKQK